VLLACLLAACASSSDPSEAYKGETASQIFDNGEKALRERDYSEAIKRFEALDVQYPFGRDTETAQLHIIYAYYKNSDYLSAEAAADRFIHAHPTSANVDYAYYMRGLANYYQNMGVFERLFSVDYSTRDLTQVKKSFNDFAKLEQQFPRSPYVPAAHQYMIYLRNVLANHQVEVAQFYFDHQAYVASANRASIVVENYQGSPVVPDALVMMAKSYHQLHQTDLENETLQVIRYNYPNSRYVEDVSDKHIADTSYSITTKKERKLPSQDAPIAPPQNASQTVEAYNQAFPGNGVRGGTTSVAELARELKQSTQSASAQTAQSHSAPQQASREPQSDLRQMPTHTAAPANVEHADAAKESGGMTLGGLWDKLANSKLFGSHDKAAISTPPAETTAQAAPAPAAAGDQQSVVLADNAPATAPAANTPAPAKPELQYPGNGSRR
jgi:outer membrane protein assembly factor BamD